MGNGMFLDRSTTTTVTDWVDHVEGNIPVYVVLKSIYDDDGIDRLNHHLTTILLVLFAVLTTVFQVVGSPIECWCPTEFAENEEIDSTDNRWEYVKNVCWVSNTYYIDMRDEVPVQISKREDEEITYYQWVPFIFLAVAFFFKIPRVVWKVLVASSGINMAKLGSLARAINNTTSENGKIKLEHIVSYMDLWLDSVAEHRAGCCTKVRTKVRTKCCVSLGRHDGNYMVGCVVFVKLLYVANSVLQLFLLNEFLNTDYSVYGLEIMYSMYNGKDWTSSPRFPRITLCDFVVRQLSNLQRWTVQCILPINLFNEKFFIVLWFWIAIIAILNFGSFLISVNSLIFPQHRQTYVKKYLAYSKISKHSESEKRMINRFIKHYLRSDGCYVIRLFSKNVGDIITAKIVKKLYRLFKQKSQGSHDKEELNDL